MSDEKSIIVILGRVIRIKWASITILNGKVL